MIVISDLTKYGALMAKVKVMRRDLLTAQDYGELIHKKSVAEAASFLKNQTAYGQYLKSVNENTVHRNELERLMFRAYVSDMVKLYKFDNSDNKRFYTHVYAKSEIELIKIILRRLVNGDPSPEFADDIPEFFKKRYTINIDKLAASQTVKEFLENLAGSRYEQVISPLLKLKEHQNLLSVEMTLELYYYKLLNKLREGLKDKEDRYVTDTTVGHEIDMINILWIYRCKKYYDMPEELIYSFIIPNRYKLRHGDIVALVRAPSAEALVKQVNDTPYKGAFTGGRGAFYEHSYNEYVYRMHRKFCKAYPYSIESVVAHLHFKEIEIRNITSAIEGIRYGLSPEGIKQYIVGFDF